jgi:hypothetical protein
MNEFLLLLSCETPDACDDAREKVESEGGKVSQTYGRSVLIVSADAGVASSLESHPGVVGVYRDAVPEDVTGDLDETGRLGVAAWNHRRQPSFDEAKRQRKGEGLSWDHPDFEREG